MNNRNGHGVVRVGGGGGIGNNSNGHGIAGGNEGDTSSGIARSMIAHFLIHGLSKCDECDPPSPSVMTNTRRCTMPYMTLLSIPAPSEIYILAYVKLVSRYMINYDDFLGITVISPCYVWPF